jgi:HlyD family secretion protein
VALSDGAPRRWRRMPRACASRRSRRRRSSRRFGERTRVAAVSPTLYAPAPATVSLKVSAGDTVKQGQVLAQLESPELQSAFRREQSTYEELKSEDRAPGDPRAEGEARGGARRRPGGNRARRRAARLRTDRESRRGRASSRATISRRRRTPAFGRDSRQARRCGREARVERHRPAAALSGASSSRARSWRSTRPPSRRRTFPFGPPMDGLVGSLAVVDRNRRTGQRASDDTRRPEPTRSRARDPRDLCPRTWASG